MGAVEGERGLELAEGAPELPTCSLERARLETAARLGLSKPDDGMRWCAIGRAGRRVGEEVELEL